jgi:CHAT domain-containing protein
LFTISKDDIRSFDLPGEKKVTGRVLTMGESLLNPKDITYRGTSLILYSELIKPAENQLKGKSRILIAPDGALNYLPFESLIQHETNQSSPIPFLALYFEVQYVPSISVLKAIQEKQDLPGPKQLIAFANPLLNENITKENPTMVRDWAGVLGPLPNTKREVEEIAKLYTPENVSILIGRNASEKNVKDLKLADYRKVHFASHGLIDEEKPQFSALVLSSDEKGQEDGFLTMREVFDLKLNADLVVLSACKTGMGENIRGEGVSGLSRSFLVAGASTVLVSLWNVYDKTTSDFMKAFYQNMEENNMTKTEALKAARTAMIQNQQSSHPYFWAPFVLIGEN